MRSQSRATLYLAAVTALAVAAVATPVAAEGSMDSIIDTYRNGAASWGPTLRNYALGLFGILASIEVTYTFIKMAIRGADMGEFLSELVTRMLFIGFFLWLLTNSGQFAEAIVNSFRQAGNAAAQAGGGSGGVRPSDIFEAGLDMATRIMETETGWGLEQMGEAIALFLAGLVILICFALLTAFMILALVESYIVMSAGTLLMGFGGSRWTKDFAIKQMTYCVSVGAKLFVIQLLVGLSEAMVKGWADTMGPAGTPNGMEDILTMIGASLVMVALVKTIPDAVQGIINGASPGGGGALPAAAAAFGGAMAGGAAAALGGGAAVSGASKLASEQLKGAGGDSGSSPMSGFGKAGAHMGAMAKNLAGAAKDDVGARLGGQAQRGTMGGRMGQSMAQQAKSLSADRAKPMAPVMAPMSAPMATAAANDGGSIKPAAASAPKQGQAAASPASASGSADLASDAESAAPTAVSETIRSTAAANDESAASTGAAGEAQGAMIATGPGGAMAGSMPGPASSSAATAVTGGGESYGPSRPMFGGHRIRAAEAALAAEGMGPSIGDTGGESLAGDTTSDAPAAGSTIATSAQGPSSANPSATGTGAGASAVQGAAAATGLGAVADAIGGDTADVARDAPLSVSAPVASPSSAQSPSQNAGEASTDTPAAAPALGGRLGGHSGRSGGVREIRGMPRKPKGPGGR
jgi:type IV secretion system protein TrbL